MFRCPISILLIITVLSCIFYYRIYLNTSSSLFLMTNCHYSDEALRKIQRISQDSNIFLKLKLNYIVYDISSPSQKSQLNLISQTREGCDGNDIKDKSAIDGNYYTLHGESELEETRRRLLLEKKYPKLLYLYLKAWIDSHGDWSASIKYLGLDPEDWSLENIKAESESLLKQNCNKIGSSGVTVSPTLLVNGQKIPILKISDEALQKELCRYGIIEDSCEGINCSKSRRCPPKIGYKALCKSKRCEYTRIEPNENYATFYVIIPEDSNICKEISIEEVFPRYLDKIRFKFINLSDPLAQKILKAVRIQEFPIVAIENTKNEFIKNIAKEFKFTLCGNYNILQVSDDKYPFLSYGTLYRKNDKIIVEIDHFKEGLILHQQGYFEKAKECYILALRQNAKNAAIWNNLASLIYKDGTWNNTVKEMFLKSIENDSLYEPALKNLKLLSTNSDNDQVLAYPYISKLALKKFNEKNYAEAARLFVSLLKLKQSKEDEPEVREHLSFCLIRLNQNTEALKYLEKYVNDSNISHNISNLLGGIYFRLNNYDKAEHFYNLAIEKKSRKVYFLNLSELLKKQNRTVEAIETLKYCMRIYNDDLMLKLEIASLMIDAKQYANAKNILLELVENNQTKLRSYYLLAIIYFYEKNDVSAIDNSQKFLNSINYDNENLLKKELIIIAGNLLEVKSYASAKDAYKKVLNGEPSSTQAHFGIAQCYLGLKETDKYKEHLKYWKQFGGDL